MKDLFKFTFLLFLTLTSCRHSSVDTQEIQKKTPFTWDNASIYFLLTDRFSNGNELNDFHHPENSPPAPYRGFMGGDLQGITQKINEGYFSSLGINAIWMTPVVEQIEGSVDEGTGTSYGYHGYWTRDWTAIDPRFGTEEDLRDMVDAAHKKGIKVLIDVVANHTGPVTPIDSQWPDSWVKFSPQCTYTDFESTVNCTLVKNLPDVRTESTNEVSLPPFLVDKWKAEGRYDREVAELDGWFEETGYPRSPVYYILKWLVDFVKEYGVDGYRVDTAKHTEGYLWKDLYASASAAFEEWKNQHPDSTRQDVPFYMVGEVYNYDAKTGRSFDYGDTIVDFFNDGFTSLINFGFKSDAKNSYEEIFSTYDSLLHGPLSGKSIVHYISSHDDSSPFDKNRELSRISANKLLLSPGGIQIYYGDETARSLTVDAAGDASLRSFMNWDEIENESQKPDGSTAAEILDHWQRLGRFRSNHPAVGAGRHRKISDQPYTFSRVYEQGSVHDRIVVAIDTEAGIKSIEVKDLFKDGEKVRDAYTGNVATVNNGVITIDSAYGIVLLESTR